MSWPVKPQFQGVRETAANIGRGRACYTETMFREDFPQFFGKDSTSLLPPAIQEEFFRQANIAVQPDKWLDGWRYACGLYIAHYSTLFLRTYSPEGSETPAQAAATGALVGVVTSAKLGQDSVTYSADTLTKATADWGDLNATQYGQLLATRARLVGMGGSFII